MFNQPQDNAGGGFFKPAEAANHLVLITVVHEIGRKFDQLRNEDVDQAVVDLVDIDGDQQLRERVNITHKGLTSRLSTGATMILGRVGQVATKSGFQAWALLPFNAGTDDARAEQWVMANRPTFNQAAPAPAPAAPVGLTQQQYAAAQQNPATRALLAQHQAAQPAPAAAGSVPPF